MLVSCGFVCLRVHGTGIKLSPYWKYVVSRVYNPSHLTHTPNGRVVWKTLPLYNQFPFWSVLISSFSAVCSRPTEERDLECLWIVSDLWGNKIGNRIIFLPWSSKESWKKAVSEFPLCHAKWMWRKIWILGSMTGKKILTCFQIFPWPLYSSIVPIRNLWLRGFIQNLYKT